MGSYGGKGVGMKIRHSHASFAGLLASLARLAGWFPEMSAGVRGLDNRNKVGREDLCDPLVACRSGNEPMGLDLEKTREK